MIMPEQKTCVQVYKKKKRSKEHCRDVILTNFPAHSLIHRRYVINISDIYGYISPDTPSSISQFPYLSNLALKNSQVTTLRKGINISTFAFKICILHGLCTFQNTNQHKKTPPFLLNVHIFHG